MPLFACSTYQHAGGHARRGLRQHGYTYMLILLMLAMLAISLTALVPEWKTAIRREREAESIYRAKQYAMGVRRYYHKFGAYPPSMDRLKETNNIRFLRKAWPDPLTADGEWRVLHVGDLLAGKSGSTGKTVEEMNAERNAPGGGNAGAGSADQALDDSEKTADLGNGGATTVVPATVAPNPSPGTMGGMGSGAFGRGPGFGNQQQPAFGAQAGAGFGAQVLGGAGIIGVASKDKRPAIHEINKKTRPSEWRIVYDPSQDTGGAAIGMRPGVGQPVNNQLQRPVMSDVPQQQ